RYDVVVDSMVFTQSLTTMLLMLATRAPHRVGVPKPNKPNVYTMHAQLAGENAHHVEHLAQLAVPFGAKPEDALPLGIDLTNEERDWAQQLWTRGQANSEAPRILINISAGKAFRQWSNEQFVSVAQHIQGRIPHARLLLIHGPHERDRAQSIATAA